MNNTRFYPTLNGGCHLGHLLLALINWNKARELGGTFIVRSEFRLSYLPNNVTMRQVESWYNSYIEAFKFVGIEAEFMPLLHDCTWLDTELKKHEALHLNNTANDFYSQTNSSQFFHPYSPTWCFERVLLDNRYAVGHVIRGIDLVSEFGLYTHFCKQLKFQSPIHQYINHIKVKEGNETKPISKTNKNAVVSDLIAQEISSHRLLDFLTNGCLKVPKDGFTLQNIKEQIVLDLSKLHA
jgi:glutamyl/glutaminyl-tRNA synthetase